MRKRSGFTLLELLVAVGIFSLVSAGMYTVFHTGMASYNKVNGSIAAAQKARGVLARIETDLKNSFCYADNDPGFRGDARSLDFFAVLDSYRKGAGRIDACRLKYSFENSVISRSCAAGARALRPDPVAGGDILAGDIREFSFSYARRTDDKQIPYEWTPVWPDPLKEEQKSGIPLAVRIRLVMGSEYGDAEFVKTVDLEVLRQNG